MAGFTSEFFYLDELVPRPFPSVKWLRSHLYSGFFPGYKIGRRWVMTAQDVQHALEKLKNNKNTATNHTTTATTRQRRAS